MHIVSWLITSSNSSSRSMPNRANASIKSVNQGLSTIERTAANSARGASAGIDGMPANMVKGATAGKSLADAIEKALEWAKKWTVEAANHAAQTERMQMSLTALARAHGVSTAEANKAVETIKKIGFVGQDAIRAVERLVIADMDLSKAEGLAKLAKDAAAIENIAPGEALEKLMLAIEGGHARGLRSMGTFVDLQKEVTIRELELGRTLTDSEEEQVRYNAIMREAAKVQGAHAAATGTADEQMKALGRDVVEPRAALGERFQEQYRSLVASLRVVVGWLKQNADLLEKFGKIALWVAGVLATYPLASKIMARAKGGDRRLAPGQPEPLCAARDRGGCGRLPGISALEGHPGAAGGKLAGAGAAGAASAGNLDMAIRSPQIRDLIELHAMTTSPRILQNGLRCRGLFRLRR